MKKIAFGESLNNDEMGAVISALISRKNQINDIVHSYVEGVEILTMYKKELAFIKSVLDKIHIEG